MLQSHFELLHLRGVSIEDISLEVGAGEVVAVVGVEGSGARELVASIAGMTGADGTIQIGGVSGYSCTRTETAYLPADRREALYPLLSVGENLVARLTIPEIATRRGFLKMEAIKTSSVQAEIGSLSGGNQQKAAIAAAVALSPSLLVLIEPTRGVDVGAKVEIERILRAFGTEGKGVIMYCAEVQEAHQLADRVDGVVSGLIQGAARVSDFEAVAELLLDIPVGERPVLSHDVGPSDTPVEGTPHGDNYEIVGAAASHETVVGEFGDQHRVRPAVTGLVVVGVGHLPVEGAHRIAFSTAALISTT